MKNTSPARAGGFNVNQRIPSVALALLLSGLPTVRAADGLGALMDPPPAAPPAGPVSPDAQQAIRQTLQLTPDEIRALKAQAALSAQAMAIPPGPPPKPLTSSIAVKLAPGHQPPTLFLASGMVANATFLDATGAAWPIERWSVSSQNDRDTFAVTQLGVNILSLTSPKLFTVGNIAIKFQALDTPITITLAQGASRVVDYNKEFQLPGHGPLAKADAITPAATPEIEPEMYDFLDGIPPPGAQAKRLSDGSGTLWSYKKAYYLKTGSTLISPGWEKRADASDGTTVYKLAPIPVLVLSDGGRERRALVR